MSTNEMSNVRDGSIGICGEQLVGFERLLDWSRKENPCYIIDYDWAVAGCHEQQGRQFKQEYQRRDLYSEERTGSKGQAFYCDKVNLT